MRTLSRSLVVLALPSLFGWGVARAQFRPLPDSAHRSVPPPYPWQGAFPLQQQDDPRIAPGQPLEAAPGVPNGPPAVTPVLPGKTATRTVPLVERAPMGGAALVTDPDTLPFHADPRLPEGARLATVRSLPEGGDELYLLLPEGGVLPEGYDESALDLTVVRGSAMLRVEGRVVPAGGGAHASLPARTAHALRCEPGPPCLILLRSEGPWRPRRVAPQR